LIDQPIPPSELAYPRQSDPEFFEKCEYSHVSETIGPDSSNPGFIGRHAKPTVPTEIHSVTFAFVQLTINDDPK
jgi:hypothetical protein